MVNIVFVVRDLRPFAELRTLEGEGSMKHGHLKKKGAMSVSETHRILLSNATLLKTLGHT